MHCARGQGFGGLPREVFCSVTTIYEKEVSDAIATHTLHNAEHGRLIKVNLPQRLWCLARISVREYLHYKLPPLPSPPPPSPHILALEPSPGVYKLVPLGITGGGMQRLSP